MIFASVVCTAAFPTLPAWAQQNAIVQPVTTSPKPQITQAPAILTAAIERSPQTGNVKTITVTGKSKINIKKVTDVREVEEWDATERRDGDARYSVVLATDNFSDDEYASLVVKVKDKIFVPYGYGGPKEGVNSSLQINDVDRASAETLCGYPLPPAPKNNITVAFEPCEKSYTIENAKGETGRVMVDIRLTNAGKTPLTFYWGTTAGANPPARDTQLFFTATLDGEKASANPKPLPDGYIRSPSQLNPQSTLHRSGNITEWLQFDKLGAYLVDATYKVFILNPKEGAFPSQWTAIYHGLFPIQIGK